MSRRKSNPPKTVQKAQPLGGSTGVERTNPGPFSVVGAPGTAIYGGQVVSKEKESRLQGRTIKTIGALLLFTAGKSDSIRHTPIRPPLIS